ncbi:MAG: carbohydrate kinase family protein [Alphaproteobacteria bacterium]|nr:carbohydrate kinase family protein [Alphaproteobacteria bacterium]
MANASRPGFVTGGTWCVDRNLLVTHWPQEDGIAEILGEERGGGGSGCNFAVDIRRLDPTIPVETITIVGDDDNGRFLQSVADADGITRVQMHVTGEAATQSTDAYVSEESHRRVHLFLRGTSDLLTPDHFDFTTVSGRILHLGLPGVHKVMDQPWHQDANGWVTVLRKARSAGLRTNMELASITGEKLARLVRPCLPHLDTLIVNDSEIGALAGMRTISNDTTDADACERAARQVLENGAMDLVVVHWPKMGIAVARDGSVMRKPSVNIPASEIAGANGAGDAFAAGMMYGLHQGWTVADALALAHATAAASLRSLATTGAIEPWRRCMELADGWGWRST